jgi:hypothetical protein
MTDAPKRLPIYVAMLPDGMIPPTGIYSIDNPYPMGSAAVLRLTQRYVPDPATCATCNYYARNGYRHVGTDLTDWDNVCRKFKTADIPQDGTGYCHNHPANQRATEGGG